MKVQSKVNTSVLFEVNETFYKKHMDTLEPYKEKTNKQGKKRIVKKSTE